MKLQIST